MKISKLIIVIKIIFILHSSFNKFLKFIIFKSSSNNKIYEFIRNQNKKNKIHD